MTIIYTLPRHAYSLFYTEHPKAILPQETENYILNIFRFMLSQIPLNLCYVKKSQLSKH